MTNVKIAYYGLQITFLHRGKTVDHLYKQYLLEGSFKDLYEQDQDQYSHGHLTIVLALTSKIVNLSFNSPLYSYSTLTHIVTDNKSI